MIDDAWRRSGARHEQELAELEERVAQLGERGSGRKDLEERHKREQRRHGPTSCGSASRAGPPLPRRARDVGPPGQCHRGARRDPGGSEGLVRNPNERLQLQALFVKLGALGT